MKTFSLTFLLVMLIKTDFFSEASIQPPTIMQPLLNSYGLGNINLVKTENLSGNTILNLTLVTGSLTNSQQVASFYGSLGGSIIVVSHTEMHVKIQGNVAEFSKLFNTTFSNYKCNSTSTITNQTCFSSNSIAYIPKSLETAIIGIIGLEEVLKLKPNYVMTQKKPISPSSVYNGPNVAQIYGFPASPGANIRVGIVSLGGFFLQSDLQSFFTLFGLGNAPKISIVLLDGAQLDFGDINSSYENYLDVEIIASVVPQANITFFFAPNTWQGFYDVIATALQRSDVVSLSWGSSEIYVSSYWSVFNTLLAQYSQVPIFIATGDYGSDVGVGFPASCLNAIGMAYLKLLMIIDNYYPYNFILIWCKTQNKKKPGSFKEIN